MTVDELIRSLIQITPDLIEYNVLLCGDSTYPGSNWTDKFEVQVDHKNKVVRLYGELS